MFTGSQNDRQSAAQILCMNQCYIANYNLNLINYFSRVKWYLIIWLFATTIQAPPTPQSYGFDVHLCMIFCSALCFSALRWWFYRLFFIVFVEYCLDAWCVARSQAISQSKRASHWLLEYIQRKTQSWIYIVFILSMKSAYTNIFGTWCCFSGLECVLLLAIDNVLSDFILHSYFGYYLLWEENHSNCDVSMFILWLHNNANVNMKCVVFSTLIKLRALDYFDLY